MKKLFIILVSSILILSCKEHSGGGGGISSPASSATPASSWSQVGGTIDTTSIDNSKFVVYGGVPYVAYMDGDIPNTLYIKDYSNSTWNTLGSFNDALSATPAQMDLAVNDNIYIAYQKEGTLHLYVKKYDWNSWSNISTLSNVSFADTFINPILNANDTDITVLISDNNDDLFPVLYDGNTGASISEVVGTDANFSMKTYNGIQYVLYQQEFNGNLILVKYVSNLAMFSSGEVVGDVLSGTYPKLYVSNDTTFYFAYIDKTTSKLIVKKYVGTWSGTNPSGTLTTLSTDLIGEDISELSISGYGDTLYVAATNSTGVNATSSYVTVKKYEGGSWSTVGSLNTKAFGPIIDATSGTPYLFYSDEDYKLTLLKYE